MKSKTSKKILRQALKFSTIIFLMVIVGFSNFISFLPQSFQDNKISENFKIKEAQAAATFQAVGAEVSSISEVSPVWPTHLANDIGIMVVETDGLGTTITATGWTHVTGSPVTDVASAAGSKLNILWKRAASNAEATVATNDSGNHQIARIYTFRGVTETGNPWDVVATGIKNTASLTATAPSVTTTVANTLVLLIVGRPNDSNSITHFGDFTNAGLGTITERGEGGGVSGSGGGFVLTTGTRAATGATGTSASTKDVSTTDTYMTLALIPSLATVATLGNQTANMIVGATNQYVGGQFTINTTGRTNITAITITESGTVDALTNLDNIKLYTENDITSPYDCASESLSSPSVPTESQFGVTDTDGFSVANGTSAFTGTVTITPIATQCVYVVLDVGTGASVTQTIEISINVATNVTSSVANISGTFPVAIDGTTTIVSSVTTTIGNGTNPANVTIAPSALVTNLNNFSVQTSSSTAAITGLTITLASSTAESLSLVEITTTGNVDVCTDVANPATDAVAFTGCTISGSTTLTEYKVRITPKTHANMPAPPGLSYSVTGTVTSVTSTSNKVYSDSGSATVTVDNLSPNGATSISVTASSTANTIKWTTSDSDDFDTTNGSVILRWAAVSAGVEVPVEGNSTYVAGNTIGTATVACVISSAASTALSRIDGTGGSAGCTTTALASGQSYSYRVFQRDTRVNYDISTGSPVNKAISSTLTSSIFDTVVTYGAAYNSISWKGSFSGGTPKVRFQLAASNSTTGPWNYYGGTTCGAFDWFDTTGPDTAVELKCPTQFNNNRYFRYKIQLCSNDCTTASEYTPIVTDIIVSWAP